jgi:hypothetical protein
MKCINCNTPTANPKFCSRNCAATHNNKIAPKRKRSIKCKSCKGFATAGRLNCELCIDSKRILYTDTLGQAIKKAKGRSRALSHIRGFAKRRLNPKNNSCKNCGYNKHTETCHIKPIRDFQNENLISDINSPKNIIILCPNCHWEFDHGLLKLAGMAGLEPA